MKNNYKGITLIALVITIILLLILAGISIASLTGSGLFERAKEAKKETIKADSKERIQLEVFASYGDNGSLNLKKLKESINKDIPEAKVDGDEFPITVAIGKDIFEIDKNGNVTLVGPLAQISEAKVVANSDGTGEKIAANSQTEIKELYISFKASIEEGTIKSVSCDNGNVNNIDDRYVTSITSNGSYNFTIIVTIDGEDYKTKYTYKVAVYEITGGFVKYDAGDWTKEEIEELQKLKLYDLNKNKKVGDGSYKLSSESGLNFTFGGFTYKEDVQNLEDINNKTIITNRNQSISPEKEYGTPLYDGWRILKVTEKDGKLYINKIVHAGSPENFVTKYEYNGDAYRSGLILTGHSDWNETTLFTGETINVRSWDMYKDKTLDNYGYIKSIYCMNLDDNKLEINGLRKTGAYYWLSTVLNYNTLYNIDKDGNEGYEDYMGHCWGIRPVVEMNEGVYIESGDGTESNPYVLKKE